MKKNILMLGVGVDQKCAIEKAYNLNLNVIGFDGNPNCAGAKLLTNDKGDHFECVDIRNPDKVEAVATKLNKKYGIDGVIAPATEMGISCGRIVDKLGLIGISEKNAENLTDKIWRREIFDDINIPQPEWNLEWVLENTTNEWELFPCIIKPRDQMAAVGVRYIENEKQLQQAEDWDIVEEYLEGHEISTEVLVIANTPFCIHADRNYDKKLKWKPAVIEDGCSVPSRIDKRIQTKINNIVAKIVKELKLSNCALKLDILVKDNQVYVLEAAPRCGGGKLSSVMIPQAYGIDWWRLMLKLAMGIPIDLKEIQPNFKKFCSQRYIFPKEGVKNHKERLGSVECVGETYEEAQKKAVEAVETVSSKS